jgi:hypothetical protein
MTAQIMINDGYTYRFWSDGPTRRADFPQSVMRARVFDEISGDGPATPVSVTALTPGLTPRVGADGLVGLTGRPTPEFDSALPPSLAMRVAALSYVSVEIRMPVGAQPNYPDAFNELVALDTRLHRLPVSFTGKVVRRNGAGPAPVAGATIAVTGYWATLADVEAGAAALPANIVSLIHPLCLPRGVATGSVQRQLSALVGAEKNLTRPAAAGETRLHLSNTAGLVNSDVLAIHHDDPSRTEFIAITNIPPLASTQDAAEIELAHPLQIAHPAATRVREASLTPNGVPLAFDRDAIAGDQVLFLAGLGGLSADMVVTISGGGADEHHRSRLLTTQSNTEGDFRLAPISRAAMVEITATFGALVPALQNHSPRYGSAENRIEVTFR